MFERESYEPIEKPIRHIDERLLNAIRSLRFCEVCGRCAGVIHPHHVKTRGSGGGDFRSSVVGCCPACHDDAHRGKISRAKLLAIASAPFRFIPGYDDQS